MSSGYPDWRTITFIQQQAGTMYFAGVFRHLLADQVISERKLVNVSATLYVWNYLEVDSDGHLLCMGDIVILGD